MGNFTPILSATKEQPRSLFIQSIRGKSYVWSMLKDQFAFSSILAMGASINFVLYLAIGPMAFALAPLLLVVRFIDALLQTYGITKNPQMEGVILGPKMSGQYPTEDGTFSGEVADGQVVVFLIGARNNHPLGLFAPGWKELGDYFDGMVKELDKKAGEFGFLGAQSWSSIAQRSTNNELMTVLYFKTPEGLHEYAHGPLHREGWNWWNRTEKEHSHIGIWHETFTSPKGSWETIYINSAPLGYAAATFPIKTASGTVWQNSLVDASRGRLRTARGRMAMSDGKDHEQYPEDLYTGRD